MLPMRRCRFSVWDMEGVRLELAAGLLVCVPALFSGCGGVLVGLDIKTRASFRNQLRSDLICALTHGMWLWWIFLWGRGSCKGLLLAAGGMAWVLGCVRYCMIRYKALLCLALVSKGVLSRREAGGMTWVPEVVTIWVRLLDE